MRKKVSMRENQKKLFALITQIHSSNQSILLQLVYNNNNNNNRWLRITIYNHKLSLSWISIRLWNCSLKSLERNNYFNRISCNRISKYSSNISRKMLHQARKIRERRKRDRKLSNLNKNRRCSCRKAFK